MNFDDLGKQIREETARQLNEKFQQEARTNFDNLPNFPIANLAEVNNLFKQKKIHFQIFNPDIFIVNNGNLLDYKEMKKYHLIRTITFYTLIAGILGLTIYTQEWKYLFLLLVVSISIMTPLNPALRVFIILATITAFVLSFFVANDLLKYSLLTFSIMNFVCIIVKSIIEGIFIKVILRFKKAFETGFLNKNFIIKTKNGKASLGVIPNDQMQKLIYDNFRSNL